MENKNIIQYSIFAALILLCVLGLINFFKNSGNIKESKQLIENVLNEIKESKELIKKQAITIDELQQLNKELSLKVNKVDSTNNLIKHDIDASFKVANKTISDIKKTVDNIKPIDIN